MNKIMLDVKNAKTRISRHVYGHFAEHLGHCIYGGIFVGEGSPVPNTRGLRNDVVAALKKIRIPNLRWPGGCFADEYHWKDGIGPKAARPKMINTHWGGVTEDNSFGTHEFLDLCGQLSGGAESRCEPYICGNVGSGTVRELSQWVEYVNSDAVSPMTDLRRRNGREEPWNVRFWGIGNENWGCGGNMTPEFYADNFRRYGVYARNYNNASLYRIACGPSGDDYNWTRLLMEKAFNGGSTIMNALSLHYYTVPGTWIDKGQAVEFNEREWYVTLQKAWRMEELLRRHTEIMDKYDPQKRTALIVDEWGTWYNVEKGSVPGFLYQQNTLRDALAAGLTLNIFNNHADRVFMANIAQTVNVLQSLIHTRDEKMFLTPTYHVFDMYKVHQDAVLIPLSIECAGYAIDGDAMPLISASASLDAEKRVHITLCNIDPREEQKIGIALAGFAPSSLTGLILTAPSMQAHNTFDAPAAVIPAAFNGAALSPDGLSLTLPAKSVVVLELG